MKIQPVIHRQFGKQIFLLCGLAIAAQGGLRVTPANASPEKTAPPSPSAKLSSLRVYVGTYTAKDSKGIYLFHLNLDTGKLTPDGLAAETPSPSFLAIAPSSRFLYAVNEVTSEDAQKGRVSAFAIDAKTGMLKLLNHQITGGGGPCYVSVDKQGKHVLTANYGSGSVSVVSVQKDGKLGAQTAFVQHAGTGADPHRQEGPHAHFIQLDAANQYAYAADLGLDKILIYRFDAAKGTLTPSDPPFGATPAGAGPRHLAFHPNGHTAYVINELDSTMTVFDYDAKTGSLKAIQTLSTLPQDFQEKNAPAEVQISPDGKFLYGSNRGQDSIVLYSVDSDTGKLTFVETVPSGGKNPRNFCIDPTGKYLLAANQDSDNLVVFRIDAQTGHLTPTGETAAVSMPVCIQMLPAPVK